jgi:hypothetical protein
MSTARERSSAQYKSSTATKRVLSTHLLDQIHTGLRDREAEIPANSARARSTVEELVQTRPRPRARRGDLEQPVGHGPGTSHHLVRVHLDHADADHADADQPQPVAADGSCRSPPPPPKTTPDQRPPPTKQPSPSRPPTRRRARSSPAGAAQPWRPRPPTDATAPGTPSGDSDHSPRT